MGLTRYRGTMSGGYTPVCNDCGVHLCWDISEEEAAAERGFWEAWLCETCNGGVPMSLKRWKSTNSATLQAGQLPRATVGDHQ